MQVSACVSWLRTSVSIVCCLVVWHSCLCNKTPDGAQIVAKCALWLRNTSNYLRNFIKCLYFALAKEPLERIL